MQIIRNFQNINKDIENSAIENSILTLGNFDGIHLGHQKILSNVKNIAKNQGLKSALLTFEPHPSKIINPNKLKDIRISTLSQKLHFLKEHNLVDIVFLIHFNQRLVNLEANDFVKNILVDKLKINHLVIGHDFVFGKNRAGNTQLLEDLSKIYNFGFTKIKASKNNAQTTYSSTNIRRFIKDGDIKSANLMLARPYQIQGIVIKGQKLAKKIGFPTANILPKANIIKPKYGVYQARVILADKNTHQAIVNFGIKPTFTGNNPLFEAHIFNFNQDIYGQKIGIELLDFIREEKKFHSVEELSLQIKKDCLLLNTKK